MPQAIFPDVDRLITVASRALNTLYASPQSQRPYPATIADIEFFDASQKSKSARYMRVNHVGEVCAQALYESQALTARSDHVKKQMQHSAQEEVDHLAWCEQRIQELGGRKSLLNPLWYAGSFTIGTLAGIAGDKWNLGFVAETEKQVVRHLEEHLGELPETDYRSREIIEQMKADENEHAQLAQASGALPLPTPIRGLMKLASKVMTNTAHWI